MALPTKRTQRNDYLTSSQSRGMPISPTSGTAQTQVLFPEGGLIHTWGIVVTAVGAPAQNLTMKPRRNSLTGPIMADSIVYDIANVPLEVPQTALGPAGGGVVVDTRTDEADTFVYDYVYSGTPTTGPSWNAWFYFYL